MKPLLLLLLIIACFPSGGAGGILLAQAGEVPDRHTERDLERILDEHDPEDDLQDPEELIGTVEELAAHPLNINRAPVDELMRVPGMTWSIALAIASYRRDVKPFESTGELVAVQGVGSATLNRLQPYLTVGSSSEMRRDIYMNPKTWIHNSRTQFFSRYRQNAGRPDGYRLPDSLGGYLGSPVNYFQRAHYRSDHLSVNLTQMKRPGEPLTGLSRFENQSMHASLSDLGRLKTVVAGNYSLDFGQGLIMAGGTSFGKGSDVIRSPGRNPGGVRGYTSSQSSRALRGGALSYGGRVRVTGFYSSRKQSATVVDGDTIRFPSAAPGNRTLNERERWMNTGQQTAGARVSVQLPRGVLAASGYVNRFDRPVQRGNQPWQLYAFEGTGSSAASLDYRFTAGRTQLYGEAGHSGNGGYGVISGLETSAGEGTEFALSYRNYGRRFLSVFGGPFAEQSGLPRNEEGWYLAARQQISQSIRASAYFDQFRFPAPRFQTRRPTGGHDWLVLLEYHRGRTTEVHILVRQKMRGEEYPAESPAGRQIRLAGDYRRLAGRLHFSYQVHPDVRLRCRFERVRVHPPGGEASTGSLIYQDVRLRTRHNLQIDLRITLFETDGFESRLYHFENDLLYVFSSTMLFDQGQRLYILFNYRPSDRLQVWLKASTTVYENRNVIGSGLDRLPQNHRNEIGVQVRLRI